LVSVPTALHAVLGPPEGEPEPLGGTITNHNLRVRFGGRDCVVRLAGKDKPLGVDPRCEREATRMAAAMGIGPEVLAFLDDPECLVTAYIAGRVAAPGDLTQPDAIAEVAVALAEIHDGAPIPAVFSPSAFVDAYGPAGGFSDLREAARRIGRALDPAHPEHALVPCHNDLLSSNLIHDGERLRIVGWAYAAMGNRYFDLGNLSVNNHFSEAGDEWLLECYWGEPCTRHRFAALRLMRIMSEIREALWAAVRAGPTEERLERVRRGLADPRFGVWLEDAHGP
jgi:aminoglycoside phosphotransferase (APT) family kinase protein